MKTPVPPRIFGILARKAPIMAVLRRGPSRQVALLEWNLATDAVTLGQWLKGRIYPRRCDLSPDGRHFIYFAMDGRWQGPLGGSWTAISRLPYLRALHLYAWGHCWNGGGLFVTDKRYWLNGAGQAEFHAKSPLRVADPPPGVVPMMGEDPVTYLPRLARDGWTETHRRPGADGALEIILTKPVRPKWHLEKTFRMGLKTGPHGECYDDRHRLIGPDGAALDIGGDWAEVFGKEILFARDGGLWRQKVATDAPADPRLVADLTAMTFAALPAPYAGVQAEPERPRL